MQEPVMQPPLAPPTARGTAPPRAPQQSWPTVIGVVLIVMGSLGILSNGINSLWYFLIDWFEGFAAGVPGAGIDAIKAWAPWTSGLAAIGVLLAIMVLIGAVGVLRRRAWGPRLLLWWAALKALHVVANAAVATMLQRDQWRAMQADPQLAAGGAPAMMEPTMLLFTAAFTLLWGLAAPVFVAIWFLWPSIRQNVRQWA